MAETNISIRMDAELKEQVEKVCYDPRISMPAAFCIFTKKVFKEHHIPFEIKWENP